MPESEQDNAGEKDKLSNDPASTAFLKSDHRCDGYGIHRVQIRGTGSGFRNRFRSFSMKDFMRNDSQLPGKVTREGK